MAGNDWDVGRIDSYGPEVTSILALPGTLADKAVEVMPI